MLAEAAAVTSLACPGCRDQFGEWLPRRDNEDKALARRGDVASGQVWLDCAEELDERAPRALDAPLDVRTSRVRRRPSGRRRGAGVRFALRSPFAASRPALSRVTA